MSKQKTNVANASNQNETPLHERSIFHQICEKCGSEKVLVPAFGTWHWKCPKCPEPQMIASSASGV